MKYTHIVWDWNGTLLSDMSVGMRIANQMLEERELPCMENLAQYREIFCFPVIDYYKKLQFDFQKESFEELAQQYITAYAIESQQAELFEGAIEVLATLQKAGVSQIILSASEEQSLRAQIDRFPIASYFSEILGIGDHYAYSKTALAKNWITEHDPKRVLFIGDTAHDFEVASSVGCDCLLIAAGHQSCAVLERTGAPVVADIREIPAFLQLSCKIIDSQ